MKAFISAFLFAGIPVVFIGITLLRFELFEAEAFHMSHLIMRPVFSFTILGLSVMFIVMFRHADAVEKYIKDKKSNPEAKKRK